MHAKTFFSRAQEVAAADSADCVSVDHCASKRQDRLDGRAAQSLVDSGVLLDHRLGGAPSIFVEDASSDGASGQCHRRQVAIAHARPDSSGRGVRRLVVHRVLTSADPEKLAIRVVTRERAARIGFRFAQQLHRGPVESQDRLDTPARAHRVVGRRCRRPCRDEHGHGVAP